jgi:hypothetical protein
MADLCAYCAVTLLTGNERAEHPIPAALGSSLRVYTVCDACNAWAGVNVDQPFLSDGWLKTIRAAHEVRDPRRARTRGLSSPMLKGYTDDGVFVSLDASGKPRLHPKIVRDEQTGEYRIYASTDEEYEKLVQRVKAQAARDGKTARFGKKTRQQSHPRITGRLGIDTGIWLRMAAKIALGVASDAYRAGWRSSEHAAELRRLMRAARPTGPHGEPLGLFPKRWDADDPIRQLVEPPEHALVFLRGSSTTNLHIVLFGEVAFGLPVASVEDPVPRAAWRLDPSPSESER